MRFLKADDNMKLHIKEQLRDCLSGNHRLENTLSTGKKKLIPKKLKPTPSDNSTVHSPSYFEHVDKVFPNSPSPKSLKSVLKGTSISKPPHTSPPPKIPFIDEILVFIHKYIKKIVNVEGDGKCDYRSVLTLLDKREDNHTLVCDQLIQDLRTHKESYT